MRHIIISGGNGALAQDIVHTLDYHEVDKWILVDIQDDLNASFENKKIIYLKQDIRKGKELETNLSNLLKDKRLQIDGLVNTPVWYELESLEDKIYDL